MRDNGTDRDVAIKILDSITAIKTAIDQVNKNLYYPIITVQPVSQAVAVGETVTFSVTALNASSYRWQYRSTPESPWYNTTLEGANTDTLSFEVPAHYYGRQFRCEVKSSKNKIVYTNTVTLTEPES